MSAQRPNLFLITIATAVALAGLLALGTWQLQRLAWKEALIGQIQARSKQSPQPLDQVLRRAGAIHDINYVRVTSSGTYQHAGELHLYRLQSGRPGWRIVTPMETRAAGTVLVDRGFVPDGFKDPAQRSAAQVPGEVSIVGTLRLDFAPRETFTPANEPRSNRWYSLEQSAVPSAAGAVAGHIVVVRLEAKDHPETWPNAVPFVPEFSNRHFGYALTWYGLALTLLCVYIGFVWQNWRKS